MKKAIWCLTFFAISYFFGMCTQMTCGFAFDYGYKWDPKYDGPPWPPETPRPALHGPMKFTSLEAMGNVPAFNRQEVIDSYGWGAKDPELIKDLIPEPLFKVLKEPKVYGHVRINHTPKLKWPGTNIVKYRAATKKYLGQVKIVNEELTNYKAGCPFPEPKTGRELCFDLICRPKGNDKKQEPTLVPITTAEGDVKYIGIANNLFYFDGRVDDPNGEVYEPNPKGIRNMQTFPLIFPYDLRGIIPWRYRYKSREKYDDMWMYMPALRRVRRMSGAAMEDKLPGGQDVSWELMDGFGGKPAQWEFMPPRRKELLVPLGKTYEEWIDGGLYTGNNDYYQKVNTWVLECKSRDPNHYIQRMVRYIVPDIWQCPYLEAYDKMGRLYIFRQMSFRPHGETGIPMSCNMVFVDFQRMHSTKYVVLAREPNTGMTPEDFLLGNLKRQFPSR